MVSEPTLTKSKGISIDVPFYLILFTHAAPRIKSKGLLIDVQIYLILFICVAL
jgi:hypothetical protein